MTLLIALVAAVFFAFYFDVLDSERIAARFAGGADVEQAALGIRSAIGAVMFAGFFLFFNSFDQMILSTVARIGLQFAILVGLLTTFWRVKDARKSRADSRGEG